MESYLAYPYEAFHMLDHLKPTIRISPFSARYLDTFGINDTSQTFIKPSVWLDGAEDLAFVNSGRDALKAALYNIGLSHDDNILIITTSQGPYISSCVTNAISSICDWTRERNRQTCAILIIHEFGFPCTISPDIQEMSLPIIEDCAYATGTRLSGGMVAKYGDYAIYSMPKFFPLPFGGILASRTKMHQLKDELKVSAAGNEFITQQLSLLVPRSDQWSKQRRSNWKFFQNRLSKYDMEPFYELQERDSPGVYVLKLPAQYQNIGRRLKASCAIVGIEATEYYGQGGFYFPVHQFLSDFEKQLICYQFEKAIID